MPNEIDLAYYSHDQIKAAELMAAPPNGKKITNKSIAEVVGVDVSTIYRWKNDKKFLELFRDLCKKNRDWIRGAVDKELEKGALRGNFRFIELYYKLQGDLVETKKVTKDIDMQITTIDGKSNDQLRKETIEMEKKLLGYEVEAEVIDDE